MKGKKLSKEQLREIQRIKDRKFNRSLTLIFSTLLLVTISVLVFYTYGCDTRLLYHQWAWFGKKVPDEWTCMGNNLLQKHKTQRYQYNEKVYSFCSEKDFNHLQRHFKEVAIVPDAFSGDSINKANALIGLEQKGKPELVYFKNQDTFNKYYESNKKSIAVANKNQ
ncbi:hypothetical protein [Maribellus maritimus]|uniref:hypothetical protein n=1 Tax=Maribellus maritimus TaxID=2870838 RepID=UPI001EEB9288|nr:hypothetical protein [Maribellus maritimus]MCG6189988.1 hypothetical protein [Maribellus maritimus]